MTPSVPVRPIVPPPSRRHEPAGWRASGLLLALVVAGPLPAAAAAALPAPVAKESFEAYCARLATVPDAPPYRCGWEEDRLDPGRPMRVARLAVRATDVGAAWELARRLFDVPAALALPPRGEPVETIADPARPEHAWTSELRVERGPDGSVRRAEYTWRAEGGGRRVIVSRRDSRTIELREETFGD